MWVPCLQDLVQGFFRDIFNFQEVRYTTIEDLAEDILIKAKEASAVSYTHLTLPTSSYV